MIFKNLFNPFLTIPLIGLIAVSLFLLRGTSPELFIPQAVYFLAGFILFLVFTSIDTTIYRKFIWIIYGICLVLLLVSFFGPSVRGATRWLEIGIIRIQPSELVKPFIILFFSQIFLIKRPTSVGNVAYALFFLLPVLILIFKQPDLGNVLVFIAFFVSLALAAGLPIKYFLSGMISFAISFPLIWHILKDYQKLRIISFLNPHTDPAGAGYNALQAMIAIGSGQLWGLGLGRGTQSRLLFLPEFHTDFVFASIGEELGFMGAFAIIVFYALLLSYILWVGFQLQDDFKRLLTIGIFAQLFTQVFINIGMNVGLVPITGITLPFLSYGGSSIVSTFIDLGLVFSIYMEDKRNPLVIR